MHSIVNAVSCQYLSIDLGFCFFLLQSDCYIFISYVLLLLCMFYASPMMNCFIFIYDMLFIKACEPCLSFSRKNILKNINKTVSCGFVKHNQGAVFLFIFILLHHYPNYYIYFGVPRVPRVSSAGNLN